MKPNYLNHSVKLYSVSKPNRTMSIPTAGAGDGVALAALHEVRAYRESGGLG